MDAEAKQNVLSSIKKTLRCSIRLSWRCASEHRALFSLALLFCLLYKSSPGFFAFLLSSSPVVICTTILLGILLSYGIQDLPETDVSGQIPSDNAAPKFRSSSRDVHIETYKRFSVPAVEANVIREASFGRRYSNKPVDLDESVPLLEGSCQGDDRVDAASGGVGEMLTYVPFPEKMEQEVGMVDEDVFWSKEKEGGYANLSDAAHHSGVDGKDTTVREVAESMAEPNHQGREIAESESGEVGDVSEHKAADGAASKRRWGRAFSVRQRKKLADIKIEPINHDVDNQLDYSLLSQIGSPNCSLSFDPDNAESNSQDVSMTNTVPMPDATEAIPLLGEDFSCPDPSDNDNSVNHSNVCSQDSGSDSDRNYEADNCEAKEDGEEKKDTAETDPAFLWTADDEKNVMDLGYSEIERNRRLEILMARRNSRKNMSYELDESRFSGFANGISSFRPQALAISARRLNPFADDAEVPGSAPSVLHRRKGPFDFLAEQSNGSDVPAHQNLNPQELKPALHQDTFFKRHESFNSGRPQQQRQRFKPFFVLEEFNSDEASASDFQRQFSDRSVSRLSAVSECDTVSSIGDPEHNEAIRNCIRGIRESPSFLRQDSDHLCAGNEFWDGTNFGDSNETLENAAIC